MPTFYALHLGRYCRVMATDAPNRRLRFAAPKAVIRRLDLTAADHLIFETISRHGPLPTHYLYQFTKHLRRDYTHLQNRLTEFYNGDTHGPLLTRPPQQFAGFNARYQHLVYDLAPRSKMLLAERCINSRYAPRRAEPFLHQVMQACVGASFELSAPSRGLRYIPRWEILTSPRCPQETKDAANPMAIPIGGVGQKVLIPDDLFGLGYPGVGFRFFAVEVDRNTESIERSNIRQTSFAGKVAGYIHVLRNHKYRSHWGLPNLHILTVTTNHTHARNILDYIARLNDRPYADRFAVACEPCFGANWRVPELVLSGLLSEPWMTVGGVRDIAVA